MSSLLGGEIRLIFLFIEEHKFYGASSATVSLAVNTRLPSLSAGLPSACTVICGVQIWDCTSRWGCPWCLTHFEWVRMATEQRAVRLHHSSCTPMSPRQALMVCSQPAGAQECDCMHMHVQMGSLHTKRGTCYTSSMLEWSLNAVASRKGRESNSGHFEKER